MRKICLFSILCLCTNLFGETSFTAIMPGEEGSTVLHMERNGEKYKLVDPDGFATISALQSLITRDTFESIVNGKELWDDAWKKEIPDQSATALIAQMERAARSLQTEIDAAKKHASQLAAVENKEVPHWTAAFQSSADKKLIAESQEKLNRMKEISLAFLAKYSQQAESAKKEILGLVGAWKTAKKVTHSDLNDLGDWMRKNACQPRRAYEVESLKDRKSSRGIGYLCPELKWELEPHRNRPAIGMMLGGRGFLLADRISLQTVVPSEYLRDRWVMEGDLNLILRNFDARLQAGNGPGRGQALDALTSGGTGIRRETVGGREPDTHL